MLVPSVPVAIGIVVTGSSGAGTAALALVLAGTAMLLGAAPVRRAIDGDLDERDRRRSAARPSLGPDHAPVNEVFSCAQQGRR